MTSRPRHIHRNAGLAAVAISMAAVLSAAPAGAQQATGWCADQSTMVILGDSTATGYGSTGYEGGNEDGYDASEYGWASRLSRQLPDTEIINMARNGSLTADFLPGGRWPLNTGRIADEQPDLVVVVLGSNEYGINLPPADYRNDLAQLTADVIDAAPDANLLYVHTWEFDMRWPWFPAPLHDWDAYGDKLADVADAESGAVLDLTEVMPNADADTAGLYIDGEYGQHSVHPTDAGHQVQFAAYWSMLTLAC